MEQINRDHLKATKQVTSDSEKNLATNYCSTNNTLYIYINQMWYSISYRGLEDNKTNQRCGFWKAEKSDSNIFLNLSMDDRARKFETENESVREWRDKRTTQTEREREREKESERKSRVMGRSYATRKR